MKQCSNSDLFLAMDAMELVESSLESYREINEAVYKLMSVVAGVFWIALPVFAIVFVLTLFGRRLLAPWARYALWTIVIFRLIWPVDWSSPISAQRLWSFATVQKLSSSGPTDRQLLEAEKQAEESELLGEVVSGQVPGQARSLVGLSQTDLFTSLTSLMIGGSLLVAFRMLVSFARLKSWMRNGRACSDQYCLQLVEEGRRQFGIRAFVRLLTVHQLKSPATFDWFRPTILLPEQIPSMTEVERRVVIWHELARIRRADSGANLLLAVVQLLHWWNPLFWWAAHRWIIERELACDALAAGHLGGDHVKEYVETLKRLQEQQPKPSWSFLWGDATGVIKLVGSPSMLHRRMKNLLKTGRSPRPAAAINDLGQLVSSPTLSSQRNPESRWKFWFAWCVVVTVAVSGLANFRKTPPKEVLIELPSGTEWDSPVARDASQGMESRTYDLSAAINGLRQIDTTLNDELAATEIQRMLNSMMSFSMPDGSVALETSTGESETEQPPRQLVVFATPKHHERIVNLLSGWSIHGQRILQVNVRIFSTSRQLNQLMQPGSGKIINSDWHSHQAGLPIGASQASTSQVALPAPVFVRTLKNAEAQFLMKEMQSRGTMISAPSVTFIEARSAMIAIQSSRPFVTGFTDEKGTPTPSVTTLATGLRMNFSAFVESGKIHLYVERLFAEILDVTVQKTVIGSKAFDFQIPDYRENLQQSESLLDTGETLIFVPLDRDNQGQLYLMLMTPRIRHEFDRDGR